MIKIEIRKTYQNPLISRYSSDEMSYIFSDEKKFSTWRKLWVALAEAEKELGIEITETQIQEMKNNIYNIDFELAAEKEKEFRHDVMAHVHTFGAICKEAMPIIHLGATSAYVGDNTDLVVLYEALLLIRKKLLNLINVLSDFCDKYRKLPTLGYTHFQPAQLTTVGKRGALWLQDLYFDYLNLAYVIDNFSLRGAKGTTGTQASFMKLFNDDSEKVEKLDKIVCEKLGFKKKLYLSGQTYTRKIDSNILNCLSGIGQSMHKMTNDIRLLQNLKEIEEPFEKNQIGSSAMAYKRNPMRSERIASLARFIINLAGNSHDTVSTQWFERTLDDSANRRLTLPQSFLACDAILEIGINIFQGIIVNEKVIEKHINSELPFMATENIIMELVKKGYDRQELHEEIRKLSMEASENVKQHGKDNDLVERMSRSSKINLKRDEIISLINPDKFTGRAAEQVEIFLNEIIRPLISENLSEIGLEIDLKV